MNEKGKFEVISDIPNQEFSWQIVVMRGDLRGRESMEKHPIIEVRRGD